MAEKKKQDEKQPENEKVNKAGAAAGARKTAARKAGAKKPVKAGEKKPGKPGKPGKPAEDKVEAAPQEPTAGEEVKLAMGEEARGATGEEAEVEPEEERKGVLDEEVAGGPEEEKELSEEELRRLVEESLERVTVADIVLNIMNQLASMGYMKMGIPESVNLKYRDFDQARLAIDTLEAMLKAAEGKIPDGAIQPFKGTLANLQLNFVQIRSRAGGN